LVAWKLNLAETKRRSLHVLKSMYRLLNKHRTKSSLNGFIFMCDKNKEQLGILREEIDLIKD